MGLRTMSMYNEDEYIFETKPKKPKYWRILICKALGAKASTCDDEANHVCYIRLGLAFIAIVTNLVIMYGVFSR